jgi:uncharacterized coiled-coil DUF342 family protein
VTAWLYRIWLAIVSDQASIQQILTNQRAIMQTLADFTTVLDKIEADIKGLRESDTATIAAKQKEIDDLKSQLAQGGLTIAEEEQLFARLTTLEQALPSPVVTPTA